MGDGVKVYCDGYTDTAMGIFLKKLKISAMVQGPI